MTKKKRDLSNVPPEYLMVAQLIQISALMNILGGLLATLLGMAVCVSTYGCCFPFIFMGIPSVIVGAFELQWGTTASNGHRVRDLKQKSLWGLGSSLGSWVHPWGPGFIPGGGGLSLVKGVISYNP